MLKLYMWISIVKNIADSVDKWEYWFKMAFKIHPTYQKDYFINMYNCGVYRRGFWGSTQQIESNNDITDLTELIEILDIGLYIKIQ